MLALGNFSPLCLVARIVFFDTGGLAAKVAKVIKLCTTDLTAADDVDVVDHGRMQREDTLDADAKADLADRDGLADAAVFAGDADAFEHLKTFLVAFLNADVHAEACRPTGSPEYCLLIVCCLDIV